MKKRQFDERSCQRNGCTVQFTPKCGSQVYCHPQCRSIDQKRHRQQQRKDYRRKRPLRHCRVCGDLFQPFYEGHDICGPNCEAAKDMRARMAANVKIRACIVCGDHFLSDGAGYRVCPSPECQATRLGVSRHARLLGVTFN